MGEIFVICGKAALFADFMPEIVFAGLPRNIAAAVNDIVGQAEK